MKKLIILIPAFNEEKTIGLTISSLPKTVPGFDSVEVLVINDGSTDATTDRATTAGATVVTHMFNRGVGSAFSTGVEESLARGADAMVNVDADGQFDAKEIPLLLRPIQNNKADVVIGNRFSGEFRPKNMSLVKYWGNKMMSRLLGLLIGRKYRDVSCGFRAYSRHALLCMNLFGGFTYTQESLMDLSFKEVGIIEVPVTVTYFKERESRVARSITRYAYSSLKIIIQTLVFHRPFRFFGYPGLILILLGIISVGVLGVNKIITGAYSPYKAYGFIGGGMAVFGLIMLFIALVADIVDKLKKTQEKMLYYERKRHYQR